MLEEDQVRFSHPLLASLSYQQAAPWERRAVHARRLATLVEDPEERARHLALAADGADARVADELDGAAQHAAARGATAAAAESPSWQRSAPRSGTAPGVVGGSVPRPASIISRGTSGARRSCLAHWRTSFRLAVSAPRCCTCAALIGRDDIPTRVRLAEQALQEAEGDDALSAPDSRRTLDQPVARGQRAGGAAMCTRGPAAPPALGGSTCAGDGARWCSG